eukprot:CAMPEP_0195051934 /NCGR_PEP_ID=MMETSP0448-20130528/1343_1 /TAXON_ID=66468 /ORGANISM="Heterocapsa triquestra, Strain CCMP 448" /LENGTH=133 /DNA_ID=CAMNT_0040080983 /DNA_START=98 /DNA_END=496 /DNA_ORIENTATION=+
MSAAYLRRGNGAAASNSLFDALSLESSAQPRRTADVRPQCSRRAAAAQTKHVAEVQKAPVAATRFPKSQASLVDEMPASTSLFASLGLDRGRVPVQAGMARPRKALSQKASDPRYIPLALLHKYADKESNLRS